MIKIAIVDDSRTARLALRQALETDPEMLVVGEAATGAETMRVIKRYDPDLVTMDVFLDRENGLDVAAWIMAETPRPVIAITGINPSDPKLIYKALEKGVLEIFPKLPSPKSRHYQEQHAELLRLIKTLATVPVIHRRNKRAQKPPANSKPKSISNYKEARTGKQSNPSIVLVGASTGGPPIISNFLQALPSPFPLPIVVVQHISEGFGNGFATWLGQTSNFPTVLIERKTRLEPNNIYVAPDNENIKFTSTQYVSPTQADEDAVIRPSISVLFSSAAERFGSSAIAILMTGMGKDGATGLKSLYDAGAFTIVQSPKTCAVDSMPKNAIALKAVDVALDPKDIAKMITRKVITCE